MRRNCRIWWPKQLSNEPSSNDYYLFGWFVSSSSSSIDVVVAYWCRKASLSSCQSNFQEIIRDTNGRMPVFLQEKSCFCLLGQCSTSLNSNGESLNVSAEDENEVRSSWSVKKKQHSFREHSEESVCGCNGLDGFVQQCWKNDGEGDYWIHLIHKYSGKSDKGSRIPQLHHVHWKGQEVVQCNVHVILYDIPIYGEQHFTINHWTFSKQANATSKKLKWVVELQKGQAVFDMDATILAMNSASAAGKALEKHIGSDRSCPIKSISSRLRACVEYAERAALHRHSMWTSLLVDLFFGNLIGMVLFFHAESVWLWVSLFAKASTNEILRSGCVWLMGVPAGFKLNTELAGILGMISLNAIQIWSTLWVFIDFLVIYFIKGLAVLGAVSGVTIPAALVIDIIGIGTAHVSALHWGISVVYSNQIQALGAIWRLFRPRRFPSGIWFEIVSCSSDCQGSAYLREAGLLKNPQPKEDKETKTKNIIVSVLHSNYLSIGDLVLPHYKEVFSGVSGFVITSAQGALTGKRTSSRLDTKLLSTLPWVSIPSTEYWALCYSSVMQCMPQHSRMQG
ncbi:Phosphatidylinositol N-acetylglucosaminyltransferase subunit Q [Linum perenne]